MKTPVLRVLYRWSPLRLQPQTWLHSPPLPLIRLLLRLNTQVGVNFSSAFNSFFIGFKFWISESEDHYKPELAQLLYPLFTHLYIRCIQESRVWTSYLKFCPFRLLVHCAPTVAARFHKRHLATFLGNPEFKLFIQQLAEVTHNLQNPLHLVGCPFCTFIS